jgi:ankyrin repeat protein
MNLWSRLFGTKEPKQATLASGKAAQPSTAPMIFEAADFHRAAEIGDLGKLKVLLTHNSDLASIKDSDGQTPLHRAAKNGHRNIVEWLLSNNTEVNTEDKNGMTALSCAVGGGYPEVAKALLASNAKVDAKTELMVTLLHSRADLAEFLARGPQQGPTANIGFHE